MATPSVHPRLTARGIRKQFGRVTALDGIDLDFAPAEIHAVLGENGAGKSTLMRIFGGVDTADSGELRLDGMVVRFTTPRAARRRGIGMVHQHFALLDPLTVSENLALSFSPPGSWRLNRSAVMDQAVALAKRIGTELPDAETMVGDLSVGVRQRLEILKALASARRVLILDEPTAVLTPGEVHQLFDILRRLRAEGLTIIFITHKLAEVVEVADRVSIMREGRLIGTYDVSSMNPTAMAERMVGELMPPAPRPAGSIAATTALEVDRIHSGDTHGRMALEHIRFSVRRGEIFGVAGVDGNGQRELFDVLCGLRKTTAGRLLVDGRMLSDATPQAALAAGIGAIPPDRHREGLVLDMSVAENFLLHGSALSRFSRHGFLERGALLAHVQECVAAYHIKCSSLSAPLSELSGGNQQRVILARELAEHPKVLVTVNPTRGLDLAATRTVADALRQVAARGCAIVLISTDLDEVLDLSDRVAVLFRGRLSEPLTPPIEPEHLGRLMAGYKDPGTGSADIQPVPLNS